LNRYRSIPSIISLILQHSPRSLEACRRQGIDPHELIARTINEIKEHYKERKIDREGLELIHKHHEERRRDKVRLLLEVYMQIKLKNLKYHAS